VDRQWSNKLECHVAQARRVVMAYGLAGARREELKDKQLLSLRSELRSYRLNGSGMNNIVQSTSATPWSIKRSKLSFSRTHGASNMIRCKIAAVALALSALAAQPAFPQAAIQQPGAFEFYHPNDDVLNGGAPTPAAALASTARAREAYAAIDDAGIATRKVGKTICYQEPRVGAFATQPWSSGSPCAPAAGY
jgi:hypothetical protein